MPKVPNDPVRWEDKEADVVEAFDSDWEAYLADTYSKLRPELAVYLSLLIGDANNVPPHLAHLVEDDVQVPVEVRESLLCSLIRVDIERCLQSGQTMIDYHQQYPDHARRILAIRCELERKVGGLPKELGTFDEVEEVGKGSFGTVFKAHNLHENRWQAIKVVPTDTTDVVEVDAEARVAAELKHPQLVPLHLARPVGACWYFVTEYVDGESLKAHLARVGYLQPIEAAERVADIANPVAYFHDGGYVHRDLKPENILIDRNGNSRIIDFGLAVRVNEAVKGTRFAGSPAYMAPEQVSGYGQFSPETDVWSLGVILYESLTGLRPWTGNWEELCDGIQHRAPPSFAATDTIRGHFDDAYRDLEELCFKCLRKNPSERFRSAAELKSALESFVTTHRRVSLQYRNLLRDWNVDEEVLQSVLNLLRGRDMRLADFVNVLVRNFHDALVQRYAYALKANIQPHESLGTLDFVLVPPGTFKCSRQTLKLDLPFYLMRTSVSEEEWIRIQAPHLELRTTASDFSVCIGLRRASLTAIREWIGRFCQGVSRPTDLPLLEHLECAARFGLVEFSPGTQEYCRTGHRLSRLVHPDDFESLPPPSNPLAAVRSSHGTAFRLECHV